MRAILIINGVDFTPWLRSGGLQQTEIARQGRSVVALDGTAYRSEIIKRGLSVGLIDMKDTAWRRMLEALREKGVDLGACPALQLREYIYDMAPVMRAADLVICRAGASTISELTALGTPALMVPSPYVTNNHQEKNARALEEAGGAAVLLEPESSGQALFQAACGILHDKARLRAMEEAMAALGIRDAAERIYRTVLEIQK